MVEPSHSPPPQLHSLSKSTTPPAPPHLLRALPAPAEPGTPPGSAPPATAAAPPLAKTPAGSDCLAEDKLPARHRRESLSLLRSASAKNSHPEPQANASAPHKDSPDR